jgi:hypothetical protein
VLCELRTKDPIYRVRERPYSSRIGLPKNSHLAPGMQVLCRRIHSVKTDRTTFQWTVRMVICLQAPPTIGFPLWFVNARHPRSFLRGTITGQLWRLGRCKSCPFYTNRFLRIVFAPGLRDSLRGGTGSRSADRGNHDLNDRGDVVMLE